jgi:hypothetical protein
MNQRYATSAYFAKESDARRAADDLRARGYDVDVHSEGSHGQSFWDSIKNFFKGEPTEYSSGALLMVAQGDPQIVRTVVQQYSGRMSDVGTTAGMAGSTTGMADMTETPIPRTTPVGTADIGTTTRPPADTTIGETDTGYRSSATDELDRERSRSRGGLDDTGI